MPRKRRAGKHRLNILPTAQRDHLCTGAYLLAGFEGDEFEDEQHRRAVWAEHKEAILAEYTRPGTRPVALWEYDLGPWAQYGETEADAVYQLLKAGEIEGVTLNGANRIESELETIEDEWLHEIRVFLIGKSTVPPISEPLPTWGTPRWFYAARAAGVLAKMAAESEARRRRIAGLEAS
jgi:hypothetical protein